MVNRNNTPAARSTENFTNNISLNASDHSSSLQAQKSLATMNFINDDLIRSLSDAYENQRARQVFEWERTRLRSSTALFL